MPPESADALFRSIVRNCADLITVFDADGRIVYMNDASEPLLGAPPSSYIGHSIIEFVHPDEAEHAMLTLKLTREFGPAPGNTHFRIRRADGGYLSLELGSGAVSDDARPLLMTLGRRADARFALEHTLHQLLGEGTLNDVMTSVCDTFSWHQVGSRVAIAWRAPDQTDHWVTRGVLPADLTGADPEAGSPWAVARSEFRATQATDLTKLSDRLRRVADEAGLGGYWIEPVRGGIVPALITVWTQAGGRPPAVHVQGMTVARSMVEIILRWNDQQARLDFAAFHDELTRLPNRKAFFRALERSEHGAVLYCDLDGFKPVNDTYGHAAGDEVLRQVAERLSGCMRETDVVARIGGDEFAVLCPGSSAADADLLA